MPATKETIAGIIRHLLTFGGGYMVAKGLIPQEMVNDLVGAGATIFGIAWSVWQKRKAIA